MNERFKITETKVDSKEVSIIKLSKNCKSLIRVFDKYVDPIKFSENAVYYQLDGWGLRRKLHEYILEMSK